MVADEERFDACHYCGARLTPATEPIGVIAVRVDLGKLGNADAPNFGNVSVCTACWETITADNPREPHRLRWSPKPPVERVFPDSPARPNRIAERKNSPPREDG